MYFLLYLPPVERLKGNISIIYFLSASTTSNIFCAARPSFLPTVDSITLINCRSFSSDNPTCKQIVRWDFSIGSTPPILASTDTVTSSLSAYESTSQFRNAVVTDTYRSITEYRHFPRYIAIGAEYSF